MNKIHRTVWSETRQAFVVAHEGAATRGKSSSARLGVAHAVATALLGLASSQAMAADLCTTPSTTINSAVGGADKCLLDGESVTISSTGSINSAVNSIQLDGPVGYIINNGTVNAGNTAIVSSLPVTISGGITNSGLINGAANSGHGIYLSGALIGNISNGGTISAKHHAIHLSNMAVNGSIINAAGGVISSPGGGTSGTGITVDSAAITGAIVNSGTILGSDYAIYVYNNPSTRLDGITVDGNNTAKFVGKVRAPNTPVTVVSGATYTMDNGQLFTLTNSSFTNAGTLKVGTGSTGTIVGNFAQASTGVFQVGSTGSASGQYGVLTVSGTVTLPASAQFNVAAGNAATCDGITVGTTLTGVITSTGAMSAAGGFAVTDNCTGVDFTAVQATANRIDLVAVSGPSSWAVAGATGGNGTVNCVSPVAHSGYATCTGTASGGYTLSGAAGCGTTTVSGSTITAGPVTAACTVTGTFATTTVESPFTGLLEVPVVPLIPPLASLPALPGVGNSGRVFLNLAEGAGPSMTGCLRTTLNDIHGAEWVYQGQSADGGSRLCRATEIISFYPIEASTNTTYGLGLGAGIYLRTTNPLSVVTGCGTFVTAPALYSLGEFGALLNAAGQTAQINAQGVITYPTGSLTYAVRPGYWVTQGTPAAPALTTGADGQLRFTDSAGHSQILYPAFLDPELLGSQVSQAVGGWTVIQTDGTALLTLFGGQQFVLTPDLALGSVPPGTMTVWWQDGPNHFSYRNSGFSNTSQGFSVSPR